MAPRLGSARLLALQRRHELSRLQQQLLALAYEQLLPIIRSQQRPRPPRPKPAKGGTTARP
jgi:hypothetical protein